MLSEILDFTVTLFFKLLSLLACVAPYGIAKATIELMLKAIFLVQPQHLSIGRTNLGIVFPNHSEEEKEEILNNHISFLARLFTDSLRLPAIDLKWVNEHVSFPNEQEFEALETGSESGVLIVTGHLGSFELFAFSAGLMGHNLSFIVRNFPFKRMDQWWRTKRERSGNTVISRTGAYKVLVSELKSGNNVGVLFDQNVTIGRAVFPNWFGLEAATSKAIAFAAVKSGSPVAVSAMVYKGNGKHEILWERCKIEDIANNPELAHEEKIDQITQVASDKFCKMIAENPEQWFWLHRRWKTRPDGSRYPY